MTVFEDDGQTGYFYAFDPTKGEMPIIDTLHIYNVENKTDKHTPFTVKILMK